MMILVLSSFQVKAHCEIPCGIYDDDLRLHLLSEHITTIEKSMKKIIQLQKKPKATSNQQVRWIMNKENHADEIQEIVTQYFLTQRIKPNQPMYTEKLVVLHKMLIRSMKTKQTVDLEQIDILRELLDNFKQLLTHKPAKAVKQKQ